MLFSLICFFSILSHTQILRFEESYSTIRIEKKSTYNYAGYDNHQEVETDYRQSQQSGSRRCRHHLGVGAVGWAPIALLEEGVTPESTISLALTGRHCLVLPARPLISKIILFFILNYHNCGY
ncbi:hypothetical protein BLOT_000298 [Blomia tropicalis]|nr:hypothetical protein BLOT_000298 [Blomia tropicalis]